MKKNNMEKNNLEKNNLGKNISKLGFPLGLIVTKKLVLV